MVYALSKEETERLQAIKDRVPAGDSTPEERELLIIVQKAISSGAIVAHVKQTPAKEVVADILSGVEAAAPVSKK